MVRPERLDKMYNVHITTDQFDSIRRMTPEQSDKVRGVLESFNAKVFTFSWDSIGMPDDYIVVRILKNGFTFGVSPEGESSS